MKQGDDITEEELGRMIEHERFLNWCDRASLDPHDPHTALAYERRLVTS